MMTSNRPQRTRQVLCLSVTSALVAGALSGCKMADIRPDALFNFQGSAESWQVSQTSVDACSDQTAMSAQVGNAIVGAAAGAIIGGLLGALLDSAAKDRKHTAARAGALAGAAAGIYIGYKQASDIVRRQCELQRVAQTQRTEAKFVTLRTGNDAESTVAEMAITPDQGHFLEGSSTLTDSGRSYYRSMAIQYTNSAQRKSVEQSVRDAASQNPKGAPYRNYSLPDSDRQAHEQKWRELRILLVGHTDDSGDPKTQTELSESRAKAVAAVFEEAGVPRSQLFYQGAGSAYPVADNRSPEGRSKNRRVEIVALQGDRALDGYSANRESRFDLFSPIEQPATVTPPPIVAATQVPTPEPTQSPPTSIPRQEQAPQRTTPTERPAVATAPPQATVPEPSRASAPLVNPNEIDFGGVQISGSGRDLSAGLGKLLPRESGFSISGIFGIGEARATNPTPVGSCHMDNAARYRPNAIKSLANDQSRATIKPNSIRDYYPGLYGTAWTEKLQEHLVALNGIGVLKNGDVLNVPTLNVYKSYNNKSVTTSTNINADLKLGGEAIAFRGEKALLYRQFFPTGSQVKCLDVVFPAAVSSNALDTQLVYTRQGNLYSANGQMQAAKTK